MGVAHPKQGSGVSATWRSTRTADRLRAVGLEKEGSEEGFGLGSMAEYSTEEPAVQLALKCRARCRLLWD